VRQKKQKQINGTGVGRQCQSRLQRPLDHETVDTWTLDHAVHPDAEIERREPWREIESIGYRESKGTLLMLNNFKEYNKLN